LRFVTHTHEINQPPQRPGHERRRTGGLILRPGLKARFLDKYA